MWDVSGPNILLRPCLRPLPTLSVYVSHVLCTQVQRHYAKVTSQFDFLLLFVFIGRAGNFTRPLMSRLNGDVQEKEKEPSQHIQCAGSSTMEVLKEHAVQR